MRGRPRKVWFSISGAWRKMNHGSLRKAAGMWRTFIQRSAFQ